MVVCVLEYAKNVILMCVKCVFKLTLCTWMLVPCLVSRSSSLSPNDAHSSSFSVKNINDSARYYDDCTVY